MLNENFSPAIEVRESQLANLSPLWDKVQQLIDASVASETRLAYANQLRKFVTLCNSNSVASPFHISPEVLATYIAHLTYR